MGTCANIQNGIPMDFSASFRARGHSYVQMLGMRGPQKFILVSKM